MVKHTPGPWKARGNSVWHNAEGDEIGIVAGVSTSKPAAENAANARLIAAAPDLLAALRLIANARTNMEEKQRIARVAIAKATASIPSA